MWVGKSYHREITKPNESGQLFYDLSVATNELPRFQARA
jgi:hypothetical protein